MPALIPVAILGFDATVRLALVASLRATARRLPGYRPVLGMDDARFVVLDGDDPEGLALLRTLGRLGDAIKITARPSEGADPARVLDLALVLQGLDAKADQAANGQAANGQAASGQQPAALPTLRALPEADVMPLGPAPTAAGHCVTSPWHTAQREARQRRKAAQPVWVPPRTLLVDDSDIALHFLRRQLAPFGIESDFARDSDRALELLQQQAYGLIFLDLDLGDESRLDGFALCHQVRQRWGAAGNGQPTILMVSAFQGQVIQVRGTLAGAQGFLGKPLDPAALRGLLQKLVALPPSMAAEAGLSAAPAPSP